jgi:hypothetical protein
MLGLSLVLLAQAAPYSISPDINKILEKIPVSLGRRHRLTAGQRMCSGSSLVHFVESHRNTPSLDLLRTRKSTLRAPRFIHGSTKRQSRRSRVAVHD